MDGNQLHGPPATPAATGPRVRPFCPIFLYTMFCFHIFHVPNYASWRVTSVPSININPRISKWLSRLGGLRCCLATNSAASNFKTGSGGPASYMGFLPSCAPDGRRRQPCGQGSPLMRPDGAVIKASNAGDRDDEDVDDNDDKEDDNSSTDRWVSGSGTPGSFCLACRGSSGLWRLWFS
jgi:hypothetical protein